MCAFPVEKFRHKRIIRCAHKLLSIYDFAASGPDLRVPATPDLAYCQNSNVEKCIKRAYACIK